MTCFFCDIFTPEFGEECVCTEPKGRPEEDEDYGREARLYPPANVWEVA